MTVLLCGTDKDNECSDGCSWASIELTPALVERLYHFKGIFTTACSAVTVDQLDQWIKGEGPIPKKSLKLQEDPK